jgi:hypothetical protein
MNAMIGGAALERAKANAASFVLETTDAPLGKVSDEMATVAGELIDANEELKKAWERKEAVTAQVKEWETRHPQPGELGRRMRKWDRWQDKIYEKFGFFPAMEEYNKTVKRFGLARVAVANLKPRDQDELIFKAMMGMIFEDGHQKYLRHSMEGAQVISVSVAGNLASMNQHRMATA